MKLLVTLFFCGWALIRLGEMLTRDKLHFGEMIENSLDPSSDFYTFEWVIQVSVEDCVDECKSRKACRYINYELCSQLCALIRQDGQDETINAYMDAKPGYVCGNKSEWQMGEYEVCNKCKNVGKCPSRDGPNGEYELCRNSGCERPNGVGFHGNMFSPGSQIREKKCAYDNITFPENGAIRTCHENGTWVPNPYHNKVCPDKFFDGSFYYLQRKRMSWNNSKASCEDLSGRLLEINSEQELKFVIDSLKDTRVKRVWIGAIYLDGEVEWPWPDSSEENTVLSFTQWFHNGSSNNGCCKIINRKYSPEVSIDSVLCDKKRKSICEFQ